MSRSEAPAAEGGDPAFLFGAGSSERTAEELSAAYSGPGGRALAGLEPPPSEAAAGPGAAAPGSRLIGALLLRGAEQLGEPASWRCPRCGAEQARHDPPRGTTLIGMWLELPPWAGDGYVCLLGEEGCSACLGLIVARVLEMLSGEEGRIARASRLHRPVLPARALCAECARAWPCPTSRALEGEP